MKPTAAIRPVFAVLCAALSSCVSRPPHPAAPLLASHVPSAPYAIAQLGFGSAAHFSLCLPPACPDVTAKSAPLAPTPTPTPIEASASVERDKVDQYALPPTARQPIGLLTIHFQPGRSRLDNTARCAIDALVQGTPASRFQVSAHTDSTGSHARNVEVARHRAETVARYLQSIPALAGIPVQADAAAQCCYVADNANSNGRRMNRRVDITLVPQEPLGAL